MKTVSNGSINEFPVCYIYSFTTSLQIYFSFVILFV